MAHTATYAATGSQGKTHGFLAFLGRIGTALIEASSHNRRLEKVERLQAMSDEQLEKLGIPRDRIVQHVFADLYHI
ncbi:DUF1127 domain-containing protein [Primorskyibacter sedentarius]|uniref:DUF1127 domain-containing protein n=1 Tax=Primorskyibacter sedentarius TaxID=745311 RepID=A0A4R3JMI3_9RHOB|nr:DUF1127 domain-containing protein [Primorskyibacter sedentarius]TCS67606.1 hypothetical protein EDD52_101708 [Primorskyibacter sedentarius]